VKALNSSNGAISLERLPELKIGVNFLGALEEIVPRQLNFSLYGIVVRSKTTDARMAGALPNTQAFTSEIEQYHHALVTNGRMSRYEPHRLYRHKVAKYVQPGEYWLPFGSTEDPTDERAAWAANEKVGELLVGYARESLLAFANGQAISKADLPVNLIPASMSAVAVTLFKNGPIGCSLSWGASLDMCVAQATVQAWQDSRFDKVKAGVRAEEVAVCVSVLHDREWLGAASVERVAFLLRHGLDALSVQQGNKHAIFLSNVAPYYNWTKETMCQQLLKKAGITGPPCEWSTFRTASWVRYGADVHKLVFGLPEPTTVAYTQDELEGDIEVLSSYIANNIGRNGLPEYLQLPVDGRRYTRGSSARVLHAVAALEEAGRVRHQDVWLGISRRGLELCLESIDAHSTTGLLSLPGYTNGVAADCQLLAALVTRDEDDLGIECAHILADSLTRLLQPDGRIAAPGNGRGLAADHDFLPGCVLWALGQYMEKTGRLDMVGEADSHLDWYRRRFQLLHPWGMVIWQTQAWTAMYRATRKPGYADFVFEIADWALEWQLEKDGAFLCDLDATGPSFHTAAITEGIADAWSLAIEVGDNSRAARYAISWDEATRFTRSLIIRHRDTFCMYDPDRAVGGVRSTPRSTDVRIDYVSHALTALLKGYSARKEAAQYVSTAQQKEVRWADRS
jgi:AMMECR1 domain-containing protein